MGGAVGKVTSRGIIYIVVNPLTIGITAVCFTVQVRGLDYRGHTVHAA